ncbi:MAG: translation elongation factor Ts [Crocinitomicaceae bacterium]
MKITASQVNELRKKTGAGMMDCKKALVEAEGDSELAITILRKKGQKVAAKRGENETAEGLVIAKSFDEGAKGVILSLSCETDFVAKNSEYYDFVETLVDIAAKNNASSVEELNACSYDGTISVQEKITEHVGVVGEKLVLSNFALLNGEAVVAYNHPGNQVATMVTLTKGSDEAVDAGKQVAMQVAAMAPLALSKEGIPEATIANEIEIGKELAIKEGKPAEMAEKIAMGRLNKFFKENTLLSQSFIRDNKKSIEQFLKDTDKDLTVTEFKRFALK